METKNTSTKENGKMTKVQKVIVILTFVALLIFLIVFAATRYMGSSATYPLDGTTGVTDTTGATEDSQDNTDHSGDLDNGNADNSDTVNNGDSQTGEQDNTNTSQNEDNTTDNNLGTGDTSSDRDEDDTGNQEEENDGTSTDNDADGTTPGTDDGTNYDNSTDTDDSTDSTEQNENTSGGINSGDAVTITAIGESTVTIRIGAETVVIPVQTTVFNGRVTKSGVISDTLCGYSIGASVMLYYPENGSLDGVTLTGAYVKVDSTRLTVSGDYNGDGSKIVFRVNGVRLP